MEEKLLTHEEGQEIITKLNQIFNCKPCSLRIQPYLRYGRTAYYQPNFDMIYFDERHLKMSFLLHEFAHHIDKLRKKWKQLLKYDKKSIKRLQIELENWNFGYAETQAKVYACIHKKVVRKKHHDKNFEKALKMVISKYYNGDLTKYNWASEYKRIQKNNIDLMV